MSLNRTKSSFLEQIEDSIGIPLPEKYKVILHTFSESYVVHPKRMDTLLKLYEVTLEKINETIQESGYIIRRETREGTYFMDYVKPKVSKLSDVKNEIVQLLIIATTSGHPAFKEIDFSNLTIGGEKFNDIEFVKKVQRIVAHLIQNSNAVITSVEAPLVEAPPVEAAAPDVSAPQVAAPQVPAPDVSAPQVAAPQVPAPDVSAPDVSAPEVPKYTIPKSLDRLLPGSEKLWRLYEANVGVVFLKSEISRFTGIDEERIAGTHGNLKTRFPLPTGMIIKSVAREAFVYCREVDFERIKSEYIHSDKSEELSPARDIGREQNLKVNEGEETISHLESYLSLFTRGTAPYQLYEFYLTAGGKKRKISQAKDAGISLANASVTLKAINEKLERNKTGQAIISVEGERGVYKLVAMTRRSDPDSEGKDISEKPGGTSQEIHSNLVGERFCIPENRLKTTVEGNRRIFNRERRSVKGKELSIDEFIFCVLCWENQEVGIDEEEIRKSLRDRGSMSWVDMVQFKSSIGLKLGDVRLEFSIPVKGSILLKEKNQAEFGRKFLDFMKSQKGKIVSRQNLWDALAGVGTEENFKLAFNQARQLIPKTETDTIHRLGGRDDWMEFYYGDFDVLQRLKQQREDAKSQSITQPVVGGEKQIEAKKTIRLILSEDEKRIIEGMNLPFEIDFKYGIVAGIELGEVHFNVFILCVLQKGQKVHLGDIFKKLTSREAGEDEMNKIREVRNGINEKFGSNKSQLLLGSETGSQYIWFGKLEEGKRTAPIITNGVTGDGTMPVVLQKPPSAPPELDEQAANTNEGSQTQIIMKGDRVFTWDKASGLVTYGDEIFDLNEIDDEIRGYIMRLFGKTEESFNIKFAKNPENEKHRLTKRLKELGLPFQCGNVTKGLLPFLVKKP